jgi:uncharacterized LabA/DUF88 family protein
MNSPARFTIFVDGSNLFGSLKHLGVRVDDYEKLYKFLFDIAVKSWRESFNSPSDPPAQLVRTYWYTVGSIDEWNLGSAEVQAHLHARFEEDRECAANWLEKAGKHFANMGVKHDLTKVAEKAWAMCFDDFKLWYENKKQTLDKMNRFHHAIEASTDFIEIRRQGRWKVDFFAKKVEEKGLDTSFAVDMVGLHANYDVAILLTGDADGIPSVNYVKNLDKHVAVVEFLKGYPPEKRGRNFASRLRVAADFVVQVYEMELVKQGIARKDDLDRAISELASTVQMEM